MDSDDDDSDSDTAQKKKSVKSKPKVGFILVQKINLYEEWTNGSFYIKNAHIAKWSTALQLCLYKKVSAVLFSMLSDIAFSVY